MLVVCRPLLRLSETAGVGQEEEPCAAVRRPCVGRSETAPLGPIEPESGKVSEHDAEPSLAEAGDVFEEDDAGPDLSDNPSDICPYPALIVGVSTLAGGGEGLTRRAPSEDIHAATPRLAVEGGHVSPDRSRSHGARLHLRDQVCGGEGFPFDHTDRASASESSGEAQFEPSVAGEQAEDCGTYIHGIIPLTCAAA